MTTITKRQPRQAILTGVIVALFFVLFMAALSAAFYTFTSRFPGANDFYQRWRGTKAYWIEGRDPYSPEVSHQVELDLYGAPWNPDPALDQYPGDFLYPFSMAIILAPLTPLPYAVASAIWMALTTTLIGLCFVLIAQMYNWRIAPWLMALGIIWAITLHPSTRGIFLGQPGTVAVCLEIITLWALSKQADILAGAVLALSTFKPQLGLLLIPFLVLWALRFGRRRFLVSFGIALAVLYGASFLLLPSWLGEWAAQAARYTSYIRIASPVWVITEYYLPFLGPVVEGIINFVLLCLALWACWRVLWRKEITLFDWTVALSLTVTHLVLARTATPHFVIFLLVLVFYWRELARIPRYGVWLVVGGMIVLNVGLWWLFSVTLVGRFESPVMNLPLPFGCLLLLLLFHRRWQHSRALTVANSNNPGGS